jgi:non-ribosomal peptide synthetase component F
MATKDIFKTLLRRPGALVGPVGFSPGLASARFDGEAGRLYRAARRDMGRALKWLLLDVARQLGPRRTVEVLRGTATLDDGDLGYVLLSAERLTRMLAHLHIGRLLAQQAERWPERRPLANRFLRRTADVCQLEGRRIRRGDREVLMTIEQWRTS